MSKTEISLDEYAKGLGVKLPMEEEKVRRIQRGWERYKGIEFRNISDQATNKWMDTMWGIVIGAILAALLATLYYNYMVIYLEEQRVQNYYNGYYRICMRFPSSDKESCHNLCNKAYLDGEHNWGPLDSMDWPRIRYLERDYN